MHKRLVVNIISRILLVVCLFMMIPLAWAVADNLYSVETNAFVVTILFGVMASSLFRFFYGVKKEAFNRLNAKDGLAIVGLSWVCMAAFGALPLFLSGSTLSFTDAFFEVTSGFTTTGASIITNIEGLSRGILFWRSLTHWLGGMGIIVLYVALLPALGINTYQLYKAETSGLKAERIQPQIRETAKTLWGIYLFFTIACATLLLFGGMPLFDALCQTFGAVSTGGFSTNNASMGGFDAYAQWVIIIFMFLGGINFMLHSRALRGNPRVFFLDEEFRLFFMLVAVSILIFTSVLAGYNISQNPLRESAFQVVSIITATGFSTADFDMWPSVLKFSLFLMMFIGGCGGSTSGGLKVIRVLLSCKIAKRSMAKAVSPNAVLPIKFNNTPLQDTMIIVILAFVVIYISLFFIGSLLLTLTEACDHVTATSAAISALSNVGPGLGKVGPNTNFAWISIPGKYILIFLMLAGRLELYSILILFVPSTWKK
ncbi:MAG: TrkH family potassium uptake protein [Candidatus Omnitrophota bacterium]